MTTLRKDFAERKLFITFLFKKGVLERFFDNIRNRSSSVSGDSASMPIPLETFEIFDRVIDYQYFGWGSFVFSNSTEGFEFWKKIGLEWKALFYGEIHIDDIEPVPGYFNLIYQYEALNSICEYTRELSKKLHCYISFSEISNCKNRYKLMVY